MQVPPDVPPLLELSLAARAAAAAMPEVKGGGGKLPLAGGSSRAGEAPPPAAPVTPVRSAERPQSPAGGEQVTEAAPGGQPAAGTLGAASGRVSPAERVAAEHAAAAAAELVVSLTGRELPSPFAAAARGPPSEQGAHSERGAHSKWPSPSPSPRPAAGGAGPSRPARPALPSHAVQWASPELSPRSTARSADEWEGPADEQGRHEQLPGGQAAATPPAVPPVAVDAYCSAQGGTAARMMWLSARTGGLSQPGAFACTLGGSAVRGSVGSLGGLQPMPPPAGTHQIAALVMHAIIDPLSLRSFRCSARMPPLQARGWGPPLLASHRRC